MSALPAGLASAPATRVVLEGAVGVGDGRADGLLLEELLPRGVRPAGACRDQVGDGPLAVAGEMRAKPAVAPPCGAGRSPTSSTS